MKKLVLIAAMGLMGMGSAQAAVENAPFNVTVTLTSKCLITTVGPSVLAFGTYTAFGPAVNATTLSLAFRCTRGLTVVPTVAFDVPTFGTSSVTGPTPTGEGVISGLRYTMAVAAAVVTPGTAPVVATLGNIGTPSTRTYTVSGTMPANQAGTFSTGLQTQPRVLIVTY